MTPSPWTARAGWSGYDATLLDPDGTTLATATRSGHGYRLELRSTGSGAVLARSTLGPLPSAAGDETPLSAFSPDGRTLAVADTTSSGGSLRLRFTVWDVRAHTVRTSFTTSGAADRPVSALALGTGGRTLLAVRSAGDGEAAEVWDTGTRRSPRALHGLAGQAVAVRPDGRLLVGDLDQYADLTSGKVTGWALADGRQVTTLAFSRDGSRLAVGDTTGHVTLWDGDLRHTTGVLTGTADTAPPGIPEAVGALAFSADGSTLAVGGANGTLRLWDTAGPAAPRRRPAHARGRDPFPRLRTGRRHGLRRRPGHGAATPSRRPRRGRPNHLRTRRWRTDPGAVAPVHPRRAVPADLPDRALNCSRRLGGSLKNAPDQNDRTQQRPSASL